MTSASLQSANQDLNMACGSMNIYLHLLKESELLFQVSRRQNILFSVIIMNTNFEENPEEEIADMMIMLEQISLNGLKLKHLWLSFIA